MRKIQFIGYDGKYPNLCSGTLKIKIDDKTYFLNGILSSGGCIVGNLFNGEDLEVTTGEWTVDLDSYPELQKYQKEITELVNENIPYGCCGGCI